MKNSFLFVVLLICMSNLFSQTRFNKIINYNREDMQVLVSLTPFMDGYIAICGAGNEEQFDYRRCSMVTRLDSVGNVLYKTLIGDTLTDTYEGWYDQKIIIKQNKFKYIFDKKWLCAHICEFNDTLCLLNETPIYYNNDSTFSGKTIIDFSYIDGYTYIYGSSQGDTISPDFFHANLWKIDSLDNLIWEKDIFYGNELCNGIKVIESFDGENLLLLGEITNNRYLNICKIDTSGNMFWRTEYGRQNYNNGMLKFITSSPDSCYVINGDYPVCYVDDYMDEVSYANCLRKIDDNGNLKWEKVITNFYKSDYLDIVSENSHNDLYIDANGYIYVISSDMFDNYINGILTKYSPDGDIMYRRYYHPLGRNGVGDMFLGSISPTPDGGFAMGGYTGYSPEIDEMFNGYYQQPWIVKTDHEGLDGHCYTELPELEFDIFIPDTVCNLDTLDCVVNISGPSAPYTLGFSTGQVIDSIYYPNVFMPASMGIDFTTSSPWLYEYNVYIHEATLKDTIRENIIAKHYNIATPTYPGEQQLTITLTDFYGNTKTIYKDLYVNHCNEVVVDENENILLSVYPNPATEYINIAGENIAGIEICNLLGSVVFELQSCGDLNVISTENMPAGSYFVRVRMADGKIVTKKIVVVK
ncbi:MAG: T9SS type A sorting domain-containing protein [Bacteroidales bacterium]|nr:T9SS type A sorting domain-containing protein [Bacteroidales bacterium]